jgi:hypothetical protein
MTEKESINLWHMGRGGKSKVMKAYKTDDARLKDAADSLPAKLGLNTRFNIYTAEPPFSLMELYYLDSVKKSVFAAEPLVIENINYDAFSDEEISALMIWEFVRTRILEHASIAWILTASALIAAGTAVFFFAPEKFKIALLAAVILLTEGRAVFFDSDYVKADKYVLKIMCDAGPLKHALEKLLQAYGEKRCRGKAVIKRRLKALEKNSRALSDNFA